MPARISRLIASLFRPASFAVFGSLEGRVLEALWRRDEAASVRSLSPEFPAAAYTTLMTTLDRLYRKGVLDRVKSGRAYLYRPRFGRDELDALLAASAIHELLGHRSGALRPALSFLVDAASREDTKVLDELEALLRERRGREGKPR